MSKEIDDGGPAFPGERRLTEAERQAGYGKGGNEVYFTGMTLRDYFAAHVVQAFYSDQSVFMASCQEAEKWDIPPSLYIAKTSYQVADDMLKARDSKKSA
jgi:hypothetical protein